MAGGVAAAATAGMAISGMLPSTLRSDRDNPYSAIDERIPFLRLDDIAAPLSQRACCPRSIATAEGRGGLFAPIRPAGVRLNPS